MPEHAGDDPRRSPGAPGAAAPAGAAGAPEWDQAWETYDTEQVRTYAITGGRTNPQHEMRLVTLLEAADHAHLHGLGPESAQAVELCRERPCPVVEIAARLKLPVQATKIIISDLINRGALVIALPGPGASDRLQLLEALRAGLETRLSDVA
ncbi:DUF742 domain-containing protein [Actinomadura coerulea]|uniref:DUF742 domain-containing protein n=1 Tax=Actinomadura coerulea TaxID=46159 RepID=UPI00342D761A